MSIVTTTKCDGEKCGKLRMNDTNHWLQGVSLGHIVIVGIEVPRDMVSVTDDHIKHFCGEQCANKWVSIQIGSLTR